MKLIEITVKDTEIKDFTSKAGKEYQKQKVVTTGGDVYWLFYNSKFDKPLSSGDRITLKGEESDYTDQDGNKLWNWKVAGKTDLLESRIVVLESQVAALQAFLPKK